MVLSDRRMGRAIAVDLGSLQAVLQSAFMRVGLGIRTRSAAGSDTRCEPLAICASRSFTMPVGTRTRERLALRSAALLMVSLSVIGCGRNGPTRRGLIDCCETAQPTEQRLGRSATSGNSHVRRWLYVSGCDRQWARASALAKWLHRTELRFEARSTRRKRDSRSASEQFGHRWWRICFGTGRNVVSQGQSKLRDPAKLLGRHNSNTLILGVGRLLVDLVSNDRPPTEVRCPPTEALRIFPLRATEGSRPARTNPVRLTAGTGSTRR